MGQNRFLILLLLGIIGFQKPSKQLCPINTREFFSPDPLLKETVSLQYVFHSKGLKYYQ